jgi:hypothetical protein
VVSNRSHDLIALPRHAKGWGRIALVTDVDWMRHLTKAFSWLAPKGMKVFPTTYLDAAKARAAG